MSIAYRPPQQTFSPGGAASCQGDPLGLSQIQSTFTPTAAVASDFQPSYTPGSSAPTASPPPVHDLPSHVASPPQISRPRRRNHAPCDTNLLAHEADLTRHRNSIQAIDRHAEPLQELLIELTAADTAISTAQDALHTARQMH